MVGGTVGDGGRARAVGARSASRPAPGGALTARVPVPHKGGKPAETGTFRRSSSRGAIRTRVPQRSARRPRARPRRAARRPRRSRVRAARRGSRGICSYLFLSARHGPSGRRGARARGRAQRSLWRACRMDLMRRSRAQARPGERGRGRGGGGSGGRRRRSGRRGRGGRGRGAQAGAGGDGRRGAARSAGRAAAREHLPQHEHPAPAAPGLRTNTRRRPVPPHPTGCRPARGACVRAASRALTRRARQHIFMARSDTAGWGAFVKHAVEKHEFIQVPPRRPAHAAGGARAGAADGVGASTPFAAYERGSKTGRGGWRVRLVRGEGRGVST